MNSYQKRVNKRLKARYDNAMRGGNYSEAYRLAKIIMRNDAEEPKSWITTQGGHHVPLDDEGKALAGGDGTLKGKDFSNAKSESSSKSSSKSSSSTGTKKSSTTKTTASSSKASGIKINEEKTQKFNINSTYSHYWEAVAEYIPVGSYFTTEDGKTFTKIDDEHFEDADWRGKLDSHSLVEHRLCRGGDRNKPTVTVAQTKEDDELKEFEKHSTKISEKTPKDEILKTPAELRQPDLDVYKLNEYKSGNRYSCASDLLTFYPDICEEAGLTSDDLSNRHYKSKIDVSDDKPLLFTLRAKNGDKYFFDTNLRFRGAKEY